MLKLKLNFNFNLNFNSNVFWQSLKSSKHKEDRFKIMQDIFFCIPLMLFYQTAKCESGALDGSIVMQCQKIGVRASDGVRPGIYKGKA